MSPYDFFIALRMQSYKWAVCGEYVFHMHKMRQARVFARLCAPANVFGIWTCHVAC
jgi:hypothetical protein